ncbi:MAG: transposase [Treponema sp.]|jgi:hypothetical protein|nr:transposase [Treponema sp.]
MESIGADYGVGRSAVCETIQWVEDKTFRLPDKKVLKRKPWSSKYIVVEVRESLINRPPKNEKAWYSGKKRVHTIKTQVIIEQKTMNPIEVREAKGSEHDCKVYKDTLRKWVHKRIRIDADLGYRGIEKGHTNRRIRKKASKKHKLNKGEKAYNKGLARKRVIIEQVNAKIKTFKTMTYPYRNHGTRHLLRMSLIWVVGERCGVLSKERDKVWSVNEL